MDRTGHLVWSTSPIAMRILYVIIMLLVLELLIVYVLVPLITYLRNRFAPVRKARARVLEARQRNTSHLSGALLGALMDASMSGGSRRRYSYVRRNYVPNDIDQEVYVITFETDRYARLEFLVSEDAFGNYDVGDDGILTFQGSRLLDFTSTNRSSRSRYVQKK